MSLERQIQIFEEAIRIESRKGREDFLAEACRDSPESLATLQKLVVDHFRAGDFLDEPLAEVAAMSSEHTLVDRQVGPYRIREKIGEGGMGVVYVAEQTEPVQRKVAVKIIKPGMDTKEVIARFEAERQALAFMEHPNIARVLDAGATESGRSYFVMELVRGIPITEYCDQVKATPRERLELFQTVCDAVQHAHQKGIIHRDIKPSNVLVTQVSAKPVVKVIDFGLAKAVSGQRLTEKTLYTGFMKLMGTPAYMSPEQAGLSGLDIDTRSDIYSLGVLLYELLTGTTPLDKTEIQEQAYGEFCRKIREVDAPKPSTRFSTLNDAQRSTVAQQRQIEPRELRQTLNGDLDRVVLKSIEKDRDRRYGSPQDLAADIERFLEDKPVLAVPPSQWYLANKYMRRHRTAIFTAATVASILVLATGVSTWQAVGLARANKIAKERTIAAELSAKEALTAKGIAEAASDSAAASERRTAELAEERRRLLYANNMQLADQLWKSEEGVPADIHNLLSAWIPSDGRPDLRDFVWRYQWTRLHVGAEQTVVGTRAATLSSTGHLIVAEKNRIRKWDPASKTFVELWHEVSDKTRIDLSSCGRWAALSDTSTVRLIDLDQGKLHREFRGNGARFAQGGDFILIWNTEPDLSQHSFELWNITSEASWKLGDSDYERKQTHIAHADSISPDGQYVALAKDLFKLDVHQRDRDIERWSWRTGVDGVAWSPNGALVVSSHFDGSLLIRFVDDSNNPLMVKTGRSGLRALAFSSDSQQLAVGSEDGTVMFYDMSHFYETTDVKASDATSPSIGSLSPPERISTLKAHVGSIQSISFSPDDTSVVTRDAEGITRLWRLDNTANVLAAPADLPMDGRVGIDVAHVDGSVQVSHVYSDRLEITDGEISEGDRITAISDDTGAHTVSASWDTIDVQRLLVGPKATDVRLETISGSTSNPRVVKLRRTRGVEPPVFFAIAFSNDSGHLFLTSNAGAFRRTTSGRDVLAYPFHGATSAVVSPDGTLLALADYKELVFVDLLEDAPSARLDAKIQAFPTPQSGFGGNLAFSPDGRYIAMGTGSRFSVGVSGQKSELKVWDVATRESIRDPLYQHDQCISSVVFSPDCRTLMATDHGGSVRCWNTSTWELEDTLTGLNRAISLDVSANGELLAQAGYDGLVVFDRQTREKRPVLSEKMFSNVVFAGDSNTLAATTIDGDLTFWDAITGMQLTSVDTGDVITDVTFSPDGGSLAILGQDGGVTLLRALRMSEIDQHPLTIALLDKRAKSFAANEQVELATDTLQNIIRTQEKTLPLDHVERSQPTNGKLLKPSSDIDRTDQPISQRPRIWKAQDKPPPTK